MFSAVGSVFFLRSIIRTIWLVVTNGKEEMEELHFLMEKDLAKLGVRSEGRPLSGRI